MTEPPVWVPMARWAHACGDRRGRARGGAAGCVVGIVGIARRAGVEEGHFGGDGFAQKASLRPAAQGRQWPRLAPVCCPNRWAIGTLWQVSRFYNVLYRKADTAERAGRCWHAVEGICCEMGEGVKMFFACCDAIKTPPDALLRCECAVIDCLERLQQANRANQFRCWGCLNHF